MERGSYAYLIERQAKVLKNWGYQVDVALDIFHRHVKFDGSAVIVYYTTFHNIIPFYDMYKNYRKVILYSDSALVTSPFVRIEKIIKETGWKIVTPSKFIVDIAKDLLEIEYHPHFIPDLANGKILPLNERNIDFLTVGINEKEFDRKGHYWNWVAKIIGFNTVSVCSNLCFGEHKSAISDQELYDLYAHSKYYLAMSHA